MRNILRFCLIGFLAFASILIVFESYSSDRNTEARRNYDLGISYIKSDLYEDGLKTLNQVAFLYPDSDVADEALFQLALIREQVAENKINIGVRESIETVKEELNNLTRISNNNLWAHFWVYINAIQAGDLVLGSAKSEAIAQYILALDYLITLIERYPESNKLNEAKQKVVEILKKIEALIPKPPPKKAYLKGCLYRCIYILAVIGIGLLFIYIDRTLTTIF